jgi:hypothetical protein
MVATRQTREQHEPNVTAKFTFLPDLSANSSILFNAGNRGCLRAQPRGSLVRHCPSADVLAGDWLRSLKRISSFEVCCCLFFPPAELSGNIPLLANHTS